MCSRELLWDSPWSTQGSHPLKCEGSKRVSSSTCLRVPSGYLKVVGVTVVVIAVAVVAVAVGVVVVVAVAVVAGAVVVAVVGVAVVVVVVNVVVVAVPFAHVNSNLKVLLIRFGKTMLICGKGAKI